MQSCISSEISFLATVFSTNSVRNLIFCENPKKRKIIPQKYSTTDLSKNNPNSFPGIPGGNPEKNFRRNSWKNTQKSS